ncbi:MAG: Mur ligase family protein, partial [bacterium]|nr:Mur ligase family protein [bacterium]
MMRTIKNATHFFEALLANIIYGFPGKKLRIIGVTGTDGKTTTVTLIYAILRGAGLKAAMITTVEAEISGLNYDVKFHGTTPSAFVIQKFLYDAVRGGATHAVLEVSSHGLDQFRVWGVPFEIGVLTNISHEHFDYHKTMTRYTEAKLKLFKQAKIAVLNLDDEVCAVFMEKLQGKTVKSYSLRNNAADYTPEKFPFKTKLFG